MKNKIDIVYQDKDIIVVNKPENLLTVATAKEKERTMFHKVLEYEKQKHKSNKVFIVHRLDRETSGLVLFAKSEKAKLLFQDNWDNLVKYRGYIAVVNGVPHNSEGIIKSWLKETKTFFTYSTSNKQDAKLAITKYKIIKSSKNKSLLDIEILTGRKHQIRVHMQDINCPIVGDKKYTNDIKRKSEKRLYLHAYKLKFIHPITQKEHEFVLPIPKTFELK